MFKKILLLSLITSNAIAATEPELRVGIAGHAFDHLGGIAEQAEAAAASGSTIIYATGFGGLGYDGLPPEAELKQKRKEVSAYVRRAKKSGLRLAIGYVCATSIVKLEKFDRNWSKEFRAQFSTPPSQWLQVDQNGNPLPSWYGGDYRPACMNNSDWLAYEKFIVRQQIESGHDGIFFDNPTVHPQGCYCEFCMRKFAKFLADEGTKIQLPKTNSLAFLRQLAASQPKDFLRFRSTTARDFMKEIRTFARTIKRDALITCNNSLNSPDVFFSQGRDYGYNIYEMSKTEDLVVAEDMGNQPRTLANGSTLEYGPVYEMLHAISHGKPVVAVTIAEGDYHTAPNLVRLAMAEAAAHRASYLSWPTWPETVRAKMSASIRPQADLLRKSAPILNNTHPRADALVFLPFRRWVETSDCGAGKIALALTRANAQFEVVCEDNFEKALTSTKRKPVLLIESASVLTATEKKLVEKFQAGHGRVVFASESDWMQQFHEAVGKPSAQLQAPPGIRVIVADQAQKTIVHLYNLNVQRLSSFEDKVTPAENISLKVRVPFQRVHSVEVLSADEKLPHQLEFTSEPGKNERLVQMRIPELKISAILVIK
jgi:hypothetical protein